MPKTKLENFIFTLVMAFVMVYGMICYNISINIGGCTNQVFLMAFGELKIMWPIAIILELFVVGKIAPMLAFSFMNTAPRRPVTPCLPRVRRSAVPRRPPR